MNLTETLTGLPADEMVYFAVEGVSGFITIEPCGELLARLPDLSKQYERTVRAALDENKYILEHTPAKIEQSRAEIDSLQNDAKFLDPEKDKKTIENGQKAIRRRKDSIGRAERDLRYAAEKIEKAEAVLKGWTPFGERPVLETYPRFKLCGGGTAVIVPGDLIGVSTGYWFRDEVVNGKTVTA